jgi:peptide-methionine (S)-S-oxide reductase
MSLFAKIALATSVLLAVGCGIAASSANSPDLKALAPVAEPVAEPAKGTQTAVFAGGCFWGVEGVFEHVKGVTDVRSGYSGGDAKSANYDEVSEGSTDHAEAVEIKFDPAKVTYTQLLTIFFSVAHDPTQLNRQGPDTGRQYRSAVFYTSEEQKKATLAYIEAINKSKALPTAIVTEVVALEKFYAAEDYHQDYMKKNPTQPYIVAHDRPKLEDLKTRFPEFYVKKYY